MSRRQSREEAFKVLFELSFQGLENFDSVLKYYYENLCIDKLEKDYFENILNGVYSHMVEIDEHISRLSISWSKNRISKVSLALLQLAIYEILYVDDIPSSVSANEAVELAKMYEGHECGSFVNGILGTFIKEQQQKKAEA